MTRREFLVLPGAYSLLAQEIASSDPQNRSFPLDGIEGPITPAGLFFLRDHFSEPELSLSSWRLRIEGRVRRPLELSLADLLESLATELEAVLECAGNPAGGSAVSNARWQGVTFAQLFEQAEAAGDSVAVLLEGADRGKLFQESPSLAYCQIVPIEKCREPGSMVAYKLNGRFLPRQNGFPARAFFPGWYGMDSVKWLQRIVVLGPSDPVPDFQSSGMNRIYNRVVKIPSGEQKITRLTEIQVRSVIVWPPDNARLIAERYEVRGFAWTGGGLVAGVNFSNDGGRTWTPAQLESRAMPFTWVRWKAPWRATAGEHVLMSRASDDAGRQQPLERDPLRKDAYELNYCAPVRCLVR